MPQTVTPYLLRVCRSVDSLRRLVILLVLAAFVPALRAGAASAPAAKRSYDIASGDAATTLRQFVEQSGEQVVYVVPKVRGVKTNPLKGELTAREALVRLVDRTDLVVVEDAKTGALMVNRAVPPNRPNAPAPLGPKTTSEKTSKTMPRKNPIALLTGWVVLVMAPTPAVGAVDSSTSKGGIEGRVFNAASGAALINARVTLDGTSREAISDSSGSYRFTGVPSGEMRISVSYLGMARQTAIVSVVVGKVTQHDVELSREGTTPSSATGEIIKLDRFTVVEDGEMSAQALAMNEQRHAPSIRNVVAIDEFGDRSRENIGDFLLFLPGLAIDFAGAEPNSASIRGIPADNSGILIDGGEIAGSLQGNTRTVSLQEVPMSDVSRVELTKVPTPDMAASGIGGSINLISKSGFETRRPTFSYQVYTMFHSLSGLTFDAGRRNHVPQTSPRYIQPSFNLSLLVPVNKALAIKGGVERTWRLKPMESGDDGDELATWDIVRGFLRNSRWQSIPQVFKTVSGNIGVDWRLTSSDTLSSSFNYRHYTLWTTRSSMDITYGANATGGPTFTHGAATGVGSISQGLGDWVGRLTESTNAMVKYLHRGNVWRIDANASMSTADSKYPSIDYGFFQTAQASISNLIIKGDDIPAFGSIIPHRYSATSRTGAAVNIFDGANYSIINGVDSQPRWDSTKTNGRLDVARDFLVAVPTTLKVGLSVNRMSKDMRRPARTWNFRPNGASDATSRLAGKFDVFDDGFSAGAPTIFGTPMLGWISNKKLYDLFQQHPDWFVLDSVAAHQSQVSTSQEIVETISAAYLRTDFRFFDNRLRIVGGVRFEKTEMEGRGPLNDINAQYQRAPDGTYVRNAAGQRVLITSDPLTLAKLRYQERASHATRDYSNYYPSLSATYNLSENLVLRAAYARTIGRPNVNFIIPGTTISDPDVASPTITVNNSSLKPWTADNYDFSLESYHLKGGFGSIGMFQKNIKDFFGALRTEATPELLALYGLPADGSFQNYEIVTRQNVGSAKVTGVEFTYRQSLTFLPNWARGFQVFVNATKLSVSGTSTADFAGFNPGSLAGGINLIRPRYFIKLTYTHQGELQRGGAVAVSAANGIPPNTFVYQTAQTRWGLSAQYSLGRRYSIYGSCLDLGGNDKLQVRKAPDTPAYAQPSRLQELGYYITLGVKGTF